MRAAIDGREPKIFYLHACTPKRAFFLRTVLVPLFSQIADDAASFVEVVLLVREDLFFPFSHTFFLVFDLSSPRHETVATLAGIFFLFF